MNPRYAFPALAVVSDQALQHRDVRSVQQRIPGEFDGIRGNIQVQGAARVAFDASPQRVYQYPGQSYPAPETTPKAVAGFQQSLKTNAQTALTQNRARLDQSQQRFADPDPKNTNWAALRKQSKTVSDLDSRMSEASLQLLKVYRKATSDRPHKPTPSPHKSAIARC